MTRRICLLVGLLLCLSQVRVEAAPVLCNGSNNGATNNNLAPTVSWTFNAQNSCGAADYALIVQVEGDTGADDVTSVTYNGVAMTLLEKAFAGGSGRYIYTYGLLNPASGTNTILVTASSTHYLFGVATSYSGVTGGFGATSHQTCNACTSLAGNLTTTTASSWVYAGAAGSNVTSWSGVTNATIRGQFVLYSSPVAFDNATAIAAGAMSMTISSGAASGDIAMVMVELKATSGGGGGGPAATTRKVYFGGTSSPGDTTYTLSQLQDAINDAAASDACGSKILIQQNADLGSGEGFVLPHIAVPVTTFRCILIRTGIDSSGNLLADSLFPTSATTTTFGARMTTGYRNLLANIHPTVITGAAFRTSYPGETGPTCAAAPCLANGWSLQYLEISNNPAFPSRPMIKFGSNNEGKTWNGTAFINALPGGDTQDRLADIPDYLELLQCDVHGDPFVGQYQGLLLAAKHTRVWSNSFTDFKTLNEGQAISGLNGIGPDDVENNLIEATGENSMWGGSDPYLQVRSTVAASPSPSTTTIGLSTPSWYNRIDGSTQTASLSTDIYSGIFIAITHSGTRYSGITCTLAGSTCTLSPALPVTPSAGDLVEWNWDPGGVTYKYNYVLKPLSWMQPILPPPSGVTVTASTGGSLSGGTYCYRVTSSAAVSEGTAYSASSTEVCRAVGALGRATISWTADPNAQTYFVFGRTSGGENQYWAVTAPATSFIDNGSAGTSGSPITFGTIWVVKNTAEWKQCDGDSPAGPCDVQFNIFENTWCCSQNNIVSIKVCDQDGNDVSNTIRNFTFANNWLKHGNRAFVLTTSSIPNTSPDPAGAPSGVMTRVYIRNNLITGLSSTYTNTHNDGVNPDAADDAAVMLTVGNYGHHVGGRGCVDCQITHNSIFRNTNDSKGPFWFNITTGDTMVNLIVRDNIMARDCTSGSCTTNAVSSLKTYLNDVGQAQGTTSWNAGVSGSSFADHNEWPDGGSGTYTAGPFTNAKFVPDATLKATDLNNYTACDNDTDITGCALKPSSTLFHQASDATDIGANIAAIKVGTDIALGGNGPEAPISHNLRIRLRLSGGSH